MNPLLVAARSGTVRGARLALQSGAAVDIRDSYGQTALIIASELGHTLLIRCLLDADANVLHADRSGWTSLMWASRNGHADAVIELCRQAIDGDDDSLESPQSDFGTANTVATLAQEMLETVNDVGTTALMVAATCGHASVVAALTASGANTLSASGSSSSTALHLACSCDNPEVVSALLTADKSGLLLHATTAHGATALHLAAHAASHDGLKLLLEANADVHAKVR